LKLYLKGAQNVSRFYRRLNERRVYCDLHLDLPHEGAKMTAPNKQKFVQYLEHYKIEPTDSDEEVSYKVLDCAYDLFCALDALSKNHNAMKAKILNILQPKGETK